MASRYRRRKRHLALERIGRRAQVERLEARHLMSANSDLDVSNKADQVTHCKNGKNEGCNTQPRSGRVHIVYYHNQRDKLSRNSSLKTIISSTAFTPRSSGSKGLVSRRIGPRGLLSLELRLSGIPGW